jgi:dephospho-coA kinase
MLKIGLTGGIGSGKSTIAKIIETLGYPVYISDLRAAWLMNWDLEVREALTSYFGEEIYLPEGRLNRQRFASIIFNDKNAIAKVNRIVHPAVTQDFLDWCGEQKKDILFFESAILFESKLEGLFDYIISISADMETRIKRVIERDTTNREKVIERINNQMPDSEKLSKSDFVIYNNDEDQIVKQILAIIHQLNNLNKNR